MPNLRDIRQRIKSVKNTGQITRAMQLVAASKMKKAQDKALMDRPYALLLGEILALAERFAGKTKFTHPLFEPREIKKRGILVLSTDKGLCGPLNANVFKHIIGIKDAAAYVTVGKKAAQFISRTKRELIASFEVEDRVPFSDIRPILDLLQEEFESGKIDTIEVLYPRFVNTIIQEPEIVTLVPVEDLLAQVKTLQERIKVDFAEHPEEREFMFEPDFNEVMARLARTFIRHEIYHMLLEAKASEHSARMVAMKAATDNAKKLVDELTLGYNKARQAAITQEILEISAATLH